MDLSATFYNQALELFASFGAGVLSVLSPCVYPLLPVTVGYFHNSHSLTRAQRWLRAANFLLGLCVCYTALGVISAQSGVIFGAVLGETWFAVVAATTLIVFSLYTLECLDLPFMSKIQNLVGHLSNRGKTGAFMMGAGSGLIAAPCTGPILVGFLTLAASKETVLAGSLLLFAYSLGFGIPFVFLGLFSSLLRRLPKPGFWMNSIKFFTAGALVGIAMKLAAIPIPAIGIFYSSLNSPIPNFSLLVIALIGGRLGFMKNLPTAKILGTLLLTAPIINFGAPFHPETQKNPVESNLSAVGSEIRWHHDFESGLQSASSSSVIMVDLYAEWCEACAELDRVTFVDSKVVDQTKKLIPIRINMTEMSDEDIRFNRRYNIPGLPTILFLDSEGAEIPDSRVSGFIEPTQFADHISKVIASRVSPE